MNLTTLFDHQRALEAHIIEAHPELAGVDLLPKKILSLHAEIGELLNEWRGFKFWSNRQEPDQVPGLRWVTDPHMPDMQMVQKYNKLLEEYADCLHFILSIGLEDEAFMQHGIYWEQHSKAESIEYQFLDLIKDITVAIRPERNGYSRKVYLEPVIDKFLGLGEMLGFSWEQIEQAYLAKNAVNHQWQEAGY